MSVYSTGVLRHILQFSLLRSFYASLVLFERRMYQTNCMVPAGFSFRNGNFSGGQEISCLWNLEVHHSQSVIIVYRILCQLSPIHIFIILLSFKSSFDVVLQSAPFPWGLCNTPVYKFVTQYEFRVTGKLGADFISHFRIWQEVQVGAHLHFRYNDQRECEETNIAMPWGPSAAIGHPYHQEKDYC